MILFVSLPHCVDYNDGSVSFHCDVLVSILFVIFNYD